MENSNIRCKCDYEDLDNNYTSSLNIEINTRNQGALGAQPSFFQSDSAIFVPPRIVESPSSPIHTLNSDFSISIPCFFRRSVNAIPELSVETNNKQKSNSFSCYSLKRKENVWLLSFICLYITYMIIGSFCIKIIETPIEHNLRKNYTEIRDNILQKYPQISEDLHDFVKLVLAADDIGVYILEDFQNATNWNFGQSLFFSTTLVTTIGYGHITPISHIGKIFCIVFAAIGIPLTLLLLSVIVERLLIPTNYLLNSLIAKLNYSPSILGIRLFHLFIIGSLVFILFFLIPMVVLVNFEDNWTYFDAFYFCFISLTTIGLGDFVPGETTQNEYNSLYKVIFSIYMVVGLIGMMLVLTVFYSIPQLNIGRLFTTGNNPKEDEENPITVKSSRKISLPV